MQLEADHLTGHFSPIDTHTVSPEYKVDHLERYRVGVGPCAAILSIDLDIDYPPPPPTHTPFCLAPGPGFGPSLPQESLQPAPLLSFVLALPHKKVAASSLLFPTL